MNYPTEKELRRIEKWPYTDFVGLMEFIESIWEFKEWGFNRTKSSYQLSTGGWSGNESIIDAMQKNIIFWSVCWNSSRRGGHYVFRLPKRKK